VSLDVCGIESTAALDAGNRTLANIFVIEIKQSFLRKEIMSVQTGAIALVSLLMLFFFLENGRKASSYLLASERTKHLR
jgi:uncharacterized membrane protein YvbJ